VSSAALLSAATGAAVVGVLTLTLAAVFQNPDAQLRPRAGLEPAVLEKEILADQHMAHLGSVLFGKHLIAVEVAGTLLLVALVGTVAIVSEIHKRDDGGLPNG
jgi:NADH:ubiquinone oxidoreductase subunit 6 (subunit J)